MSVKKAFFSSVASLLVAVIISPVSICAKTNSYDNVQQIAENAPSYVLGHNKGWNNTSASNIKPLYDFNNQLVAYSVDIKNKENNQPAYVIIGESKDDAPILEFCPGHLSPYDKISSDQVCVYDRATCYYSKDGSQNSYYDIKNHSKLSTNFVKYLIAESKNKKTVSPKSSIAKTERSKLAVKNDNIKVSPSTVMSSKILDNVPDYYWRRGCSPTAAAMVLKYTYYLPLYNVSYVTLIDQLASAMSTDSGGGTRPDNIPAGIRTALEYHGQQVFTWNDPDGAGKDGNTYQEFCSEINDDHPVIINVYGSTQKSRSYPTGFGDHSMAGIGYQLTSSYSYVVVHDTGTDGDVYLNYDSAAFGVPLFTYVHYSLE